ncbi:MAG: hypothetical protein HPY74_19465 [Firmicutes bacterium]|nr:hypothetical protein [Bacillota bacterium]
MSKNKTVTIIYRGKDIGGIIPFQHIENSLKTIKTFVEKTIEEEAEEFKFFNFLIVITKQDGL